MLYGSDECLELVNDLCLAIKSRYDNVTFTQQSINNWDEVDLMPIENLIRVDVDEEIIYINQILRDALNFVGYANNQLYDLLDYNIDFNKILPTDIIQYLPVANDYTLNQYEKIKECVLN